MLSARSNPRRRTRRVAPGFVGSGDDDQFYQKILAGYAKKMKKAAAEYADMGGRGEVMSEKLSWEVDYLSRWLPKQLDGDQARALVKEAILALGVSGQPRAKGRVIGYIVKDHRGVADGRVVAEMTAKELQSAI